jgi:hypothetical protein
VLSSCHREKVESLGPSYISAPPDFAVNSFSASTSSADLSSGDVKFNATFTNPVTWTLTIKGQTSGAIYQVQGTGSSITNLSWTGAMTGVAFFRTGETVTATLSFFGSTITSSTNITLTGVPDFTTCGLFPFYGDFEDTASVLAWHTPTGPHYSPNYAHFNFPTPIANVDQGIDSVAVDYKGNPVPSVQGKKYYYIKGLGAQSVFVSGMQYLGGNLFSNLPADPNQVWFNIYVYGSGDPNSEIQIDLQEDENSNFSYEPGKEDAYVQLITLDHKGWKLFSFPYSKFTISVDPHFGGSGNKIKEPQFVRNFDVVLLKKLNPNSPAEVYFDYPIFTVGGPFKPCK